MAGRAGAFAQQPVILFATGGQLLSGQLVHPYSGLLALTRLLLHGDEHHAMRAQGISVQCALAVVALFLDGVEELGKVAATGGFEVYEGATLAFGAVDEQVGAHFDGEAGGLVGGGGRGHRRGWWG